MPVRSDGSRLRMWRRWRSQQLEALGLHGPVDVDIRRRRDGQPVVLEVNARFGANIQHAPEVFERVVAEHLSI